MTSEPDTRGLAASELHEAITAVAGTDREVLTSDDHQTYTRERTQIEATVQALRDAAATVADLDTDLAAAEDAARAEDERGRQLEESSTRVDRLTHAHAAVAATSATTATTASAVTDLTETIGSRAHAYGTCRSCDARRFGSSPASPAVVGGRPGSWGHVVMAGQE
ncbi:hypothetical protein [Rhodococcus opacus]|uniref:hypothetical protein n=1 Tax=Rhodococcus opacus TaxID=37919 RepID=UPI0012DB50A4|nr:hypothetical protein [Rhodococcus opacus]